MNAQVTNFRATAYRGQFEATEGTITVSGEVATNSEKTITNFSGSVTEDGERIGSFNAYWNGEKLLYNISDADIENVGSVATAVAAAQEAVEVAIANE